MKGQSGGSYDQIWILICKSKSEGKTLIILATIILHNTAFPCEVSIMSLVSLEIDTGIHMHDKESKQIKWFWAHFTDLKKSHKRFNFYQLEFPVYSLPYFHPISQNKVNFFSTYFVYFLWKYSKSIESRCLHWAIANCTDDLVLFSKWKDFRLIRWIKRIGQNQPYIN